MPAAIVVGDRRQARLGRRDLDEQVRPVDQPPQVRWPRRSVASVSWARPRVDLDGDPAVAGRWRVVDRAQQVAGVADVGGGDGAQRLLDARPRGRPGRAPGRRRSPTPLIAVGEDRRVGGDADDGVLVDQRLQVAAADAVAGEVVEPDGDAGGGQLGQLLVLCHVGAFRSDGVARLSGRRWGGAGRRSPRPGRPGRRCRTAAAMLSRAAATTASAVKPNCSYSTV